ncbi:hypothetical protein ACP70R_048374 [Stipagrostis hirtigluma subsp. patula]
MMARRVTGPSLLASSLLVLAMVTATASETVKVSTTPVFPAIPWSQQRKDFEVLVRVEAPAAAKRRTPIDLVAVLDVSGSMNAPAALSEGPSRLDLLKKAMKFIIKELDDGDRLAIVAFNDQVAEEYSTDLLRISGEGRSDARRKVEELMAGGSTAFKPALERAAQILDKRPADCNHAGFVIFLSDGVDNSGMKWCEESIGNGRNNLIRAALGKYPVHTFGFSASHDPKALYLIAKESRGTYSFVDDEDLGSLTGAFAVCLGGLKSVVAVDTRVKLMAAEHGGVQIRGIESGGYRSHVSCDGTWGEIVLGALYAGEVKNFVVRLHVPAATAAACCSDDRHHQQQQLVTVDAAGHSSYGGRTISMEAASDVLRIQRTKAVAGAGADAGRQLAPSPAVMNYIVRFELLELVSKFVREELDVVEDVAATVIDLGGRLESKWEEFIHGHKFWSGADLGGLDGDMSAMVGSLRRGGAGAGAAAYIYSWASSYQMQRATAMGSPDKVAAEFLTQEMRLMLSEAREFFDEPVSPRPAAPAVATKEGFERIDRRLESWLKLKRDLFDQPSEPEEDGGGESSHLAALLQEASMEAINRAMHHDMYLAVVHASNVRQCSSGRAGRGTAAA